MTCFIHEIDCGNGGRKLWCYLPNATERSFYRQNRPAVVIYPGGGYGFTYEGEAEPIALSFVAAGVCAFVLDYSTKALGEKVFPYAQKEAFAAIRYVRENAGEWGIASDNIATLGFSAGGHLCGCTGTLWNKERMGSYFGALSRESRPDKMILCYPVIRAFSPCHRGSFVNLLGEENMSDEMMDALSLEKQVDDDTPPTFIWATAEDTGVPIQGALEFAHALADHHVHVELHIYPHGGHGLCLANHVTEAFSYRERLYPAEWMKAAIQFLFDSKLSEKIK